MNKVKSIKSRILTPFLAVVIIIPIITLLIFNAAMLIYVHNNAKQELKNTMSAMNTTIRQAFVKEGIDLTDEHELLKAVLSIKNVKQASKVALNTDILVFNKDGQLIYSAGYDSTPVLDKIEILYKNIKKTETIHTENGSYLVASKTLAVMKRSPTVVFVTSLNSADGLILAINCIFITLMIAGSAISILITKKISENVSESANELCKAAKRIGDGRYEAIENQSGIQEIAELTDSIAQMGEKLQAQEQAQKAFLQNASHELRTPLMSIGGYAEGLESGVLTDIKKSAGIIKNECDRLNVLVGDLLTLSKIENSSYEKELRMLNLSEILMDYKSSLDGIALKANKKITFVAGEDVFINADEGLLSRIIFNIAGNSIRYAENEVNIRLSQNTLTISDDGSGIDENDLPHIFERFYKGQNGNFGLGLAIAKSAVEFMGGSIKAYNNAGAVFEIHFP